MIVVDDIAAFLAANGVIATGVVMTKGRLPEQPDSLVAVTEYGGLAPQVSHDGGVRRFPRVQVLVRDRDPRVARSTAQAIYDLMLATRAMNQANLLMGATQYEVVLPLAEPFPLSADTQGRTTVACNYECRCGI